MFELHYVLSLNITVGYCAAYCAGILAELAERSPIIIQNGSSNSSSRKNLDLRPYDRPYKVLLLTFVVNCTAGTQARQRHSFVQ